MTKSTNDEWYDPTTSIEPASPLDDALGKVSSAVEAAMAVAEETAPTGTALTKSTDDAVAMKRQFAAKHSQLTKASNAAEAARVEMKAAIETARKQADAMIRRAQADMEAKMRELEPLIAQAARLQDGIKAMNLYLGRDEWVVTIRTGTPAPKDEPLTIRQTVLAMDEETALLADGHGIDFTTIELFDEWLLADPRNLDQVLPEKRGVVAIMARRRDINYGDPWSNVAKNKANHETWWLIRNGQNIYRIVIDEFSVGSRLIPKADEFTALFLRRGHDGTETPIQPGSDAWVQAETVADIKTRHYMKIALVLQGLVARTAYFHPLPVEELSVIDQHHYDQGYVRLVTDDEKAIDTGRPSFTSWLTEKNSHVRAGARVVGAYSGAYGKNDSRNGAKASFKGYGTGPDPLSIQVVEDMSADGTASFLFKVPTYRYDRITYMNVPDGGFEEKRTRYRFAPGDGDFIAIDFVRPAEIRYYLESRSERRTYLKMFPVLTAALAALEAEAEAERPFRNLLSAALAAQENLSDDQAAELSDDLVSHWKLANKWSRPLNGAPDMEAKATRMILAEAARRRRSLSSGNDDDAVAKAHELFSNVLAVARRTNDYVVVERIEREWSREADGDNRWRATAVRGDVYVNIYILSKTGAVKETRTWQTLTRTQVGKWAIVYEHASWAKWQLDVKKELHLTDEQVRTHIIEPLLAHAAAKGWTVLAISADAAGESIYKIAGGNLHFYTDADLPASPLEGQELTHPGDTGFYSHSVSYSVSPKTLRLRITEADRCRDNSWDFDSRSSWHHGPFGERGTGRPEGPWFWHNERHQLVHIDEAAVDAVRAYGSAWLESRKLMLELSADAAELVAGISDAWEVRDLENQRLAFVEEYGDASLWEDHQKSITVENPYKADRRRPRVTYVEMAGWPVFTQAVRGRVEAREELHGRTVAEVFGADLTAFEPTIGELRFSARETGQSLVPRMDHP